MADYSKCQTTAKNKFPVRHGAYPRGAYQNHAHYLHDILQQKAPSREITLDERIYCMRMRAGLLRGKMANVQERRQQFGPSVKWDIYRCP